MRKTSTAKASFPALDDVLSEVEPEARCQLYLTVALASVINNRTTAAKLAAERASQLALAGSVEEARARLYHAGALAAMPKLIDTAVTDLAGVNRELLAPSDQALMDVVAIAIAGVRSGTDRAAISVAAAEPLGDADPAAEDAVLQARPRRSESLGRHPRRSGAMNVLAKLLAETGASLVGARPEPDGGRQAENGAFRSLLERMGLSAPASGDGAPATAATPAGEEGPDTPSKEESDDTHAATPKRIVSFPASLGRLDHNKRGAQNLAQDVNVDPAAAVALAGGGNGFRTSLSSLRRCKATRWHRSRRLPARAAKANGLAGAVRNRRR